MAQKKATKKTQGQSAHVTATYQKEIIRGELRELGDVLRDLKNCQLRYFTLAITGTGAIISLAKSFGGDFRVVTFLAPLCIIIPCWMIFFDKATTITRTAGYKRILEKQLRGHLGRYRHLGYENALPIFRAGEEEVWNRLQSRRPKRKRVEACASLLPRTRFRFWAINWYTFLMLSIVCVVLAASELLRSNGLLMGLALLGMALVFVALCSIYAYTLVRSVTSGELSYAACALKWHFLLRRP